jgi:2-polyprenyl-3-methyl-5-hydroxy-6-metoxy-1,4-benzoquinol methylase
MSAVQTAAIDERKLNDFLGRVVGDLGAAMNAALVVIGDRLGLYKALVAAGPVTSAELAERTGTHERYLREWLAAQAAGDYLHYDPVTARYSLPPEQAAALADESSPAFAPGGFHIVEAAMQARERMTENFRTGGGIAWDDHAACLFEGAERFFRPGYRDHLVDSWIPALEGVKAKLERGAKVADVGCGQGASTILMAQAFPASRFIGFDAQAESVRRAQRHAQAAGVADRVSFEVARSSDYSGTGYDLVTRFDSLHGMDRPTESARHVRRTLAADGTWMIVEPLAGDRVEENLNPVGRVYYAASTMLCVPNALAQQGLALGAQAGPARLRHLAVEGGFSRFRCVSATPFQMVLEVRP